MGPRSSLVVPVSEVAEKVSRTLTYDRAVFRGRNEAQWCRRLYVARVLPCVTRCWVRVLRIAIEPAEMVCTSAGARKKSRDALLLGKIMIHSTYYRRTLGIGPVERAETHTRVRLSLRASEACVGSDSDKLS